MQTERFFINRDGFDLHFSPLLDQDLVEIEKYVEETRHLQEIQHLFQIFKFNIDQLTAKYNPMPSGAITRTQGNSLADSDGDFIAVNSLLTNIISSGRTLTESMETFDKSFHPESYVKQEPVLSEYRKLSTATYDSSFAYRFLIRMRDYTQHGHLLASAERGHFWFDMVAILNKPHYKHNGTIEDELERFTGELIEQYRDEPTLSFTVTLAEYVAVLCNLYAKFLPIIWKCIRPAVKKAKTIVRRYPRNIFNADTLSPGFFIYRYDDRDLHAFYLGDNPKMMFTKIKADAESTARHFQEEWDTIRKNTLTIRLTGENGTVTGIELGTLECIT